MIDMTLKHIPIDSVPAFRSRQRELFGREERGFTIVELLIVIVVIAILASIIFLGYRGVQNRAVDVSIKSDLQGGATELERVSVNKQEYPLTGAELNNGSGFVTSKDVNLTYKRRLASYCLEGSSDRAGSAIFHIDSADPNKILDGPCVLVVSTLAGSGTSGYANGFRTSAQFKGPHGLAIGSDNTIYVADHEDHRIRVISPSGVVSTLAGTGVAGYSDGPGATAKFRNPMGIAVDKGGNVYVADEANHRIRKITPGGMVSTFAGSTAGFADGTGAAAQFNYPRGIVVTDNGTLYVSDFNNDRIRIVSPSGVVSTLAGSSVEGSLDGMGSDAQFNGPWGLSMGPTGDLFVADSINARIRRVTLAGNVTTYAGTVYGFEDGPVSTARFSTIHDVAVAIDGTVYVADTLNHRIRKISTAGMVSTYAGTDFVGLIDGDLAAASFGETHGLAVDKYGGLYVGELYNYVVRKIE